MARVVEKFPKKHRGRPAIYPWDDWGNGEAWTVTQGEDFHTTPASFRALVHRTANARGHKAETVIDPHTRSVTFRFFDPEQ